MNRLLLPMLAGLFLAACTDVGQVDVGRAPAVYTAEMPSVDATARGSGEVVPLAISDVRIAVIEVE